MKKIIGYSLISLPFVALTVGMIFDLGWQAVAMLWLGIFGVAAIIALGAILVID